MDVVILILSLIPVTIGVETNIAIFTDLVEFFNMKHPLIIRKNVPDLGLDELPTIPSPVTFMSYETNEEVEQVLKHVKMLQSMAELDSILFTGSGHRTLVQSMVNDLKLFNFGITGVLPESEYMGLNLNLTFSTRLFILDEEESHTTKVREVYAVMGLQMTCNMGSWNETVRLTIGQPNIWERRANLNGASIRVTSLNYSTATANLQFQSLHYLNNNVTGGGGYFIAPLYYLASKLNFTIQFKYSKDGKWGGRDYNILIGN